MRRFSMGRFMFAAAMVGSITTLCLVINLICVAIFGRSDLDMVATTWYGALAALAVAIGMFYIAYFDKPIGKEIEHYEDLLEGEES